MKKKSERKRLVILAHYYTPDTASTGQIIRELAEGLLDTFDVTVICVVPSYLGTIEEKYKTRKYYTEMISGVKVVRIRVPEFDKTKSMSRVKNIMSYFFGAMGGDGTDRETGLCVFHITTAYTWRTSGSMGKMGKTCQIHI